ncbi:MAG TPA: acyl-CoA dehydrogenase family protein [Thermoanaerobaculia bacterium]
MITSRPAPVPTLDLAGLVADFATRAAEHDRAASFPFENFKLLHAAGLLGFTVSRELGGQGAGLLAASRVVRSAFTGRRTTASYAAPAVPRCRSEPAGDWSRRNAAAAAVTSAIPR